MRHAHAGISLNGAPSQYDRWLDGEDTDRVRVDGRSFGELLSFAVQFGRLVKFYDLDNQPDDDWTLFFLTDPTMVLASVESINLRELEQQFRQWLRRIREQRSEQERLEVVRICMAFLLAQARQADAWLSGVQMSPRSHAARMFTGEVATWIDTCLREQIVQLASLADGIASPNGLNQPMELDFSGFHPLWQMAKLGEGSTRPGPATALIGSHGRGKKFENAASILEEIFAVFLYVFGEVQKLARRHLPETLRDPYHKPQIALYIAFVRLFETAQRTMNTLSDRFAHFYYHEVLRETRAGPVPDTVFLTLTLDPTSGMAEVDVPAGTLFLAGTEADGSSILFASDSTLSVTGAAIAVARGIRTTYGPLFRVPVDSPDSFGMTIVSPGVRDVKQAVLGTTIDVALMNDEAAGKGLPAGLAQWPLFGAAATGITDIAVTAPVTLGFAISSAWLMLTGGDRRITLTFRLRAGDASRLRPDLKDLAAATGIESSAVFEQVLSQAFEIWLSTTEGWFQPESYSCKAVPMNAAAPRAFVLSFALAPTAPPFVAFNPAGLNPPPKPTGPDNLNPDASLPTLKAYLRPTPAALNGVEEVETWPYSLLCELGFDSVEIATETENLTDFIVRTTSGEVDTSTPYPVFGAAWVTGSYFQFSNPELFVKTPNRGSLMVNLEWFGLPPNEDGFAGYYAGYTVGLNGQPSPTVLFDNQTFRGQWEVVNPGLWDLVDFGAPGLQSPPVGSGVFLFRTTNECSDPVPEPDGALCTVTRFDYLETERRTPPEYYDPDASAIRLTLTEPPYAFGSSLYASNVMAATIAELPKTVPDVIDEPACRPYADAADSLNAALSPGLSAEAVQAVVSQAQEALIQSSEMCLLNRAAGDDAAISQVNAAYDVPSSKAPAYRAQVIRTRLQAGLSGAESPAGWPESLSCSVRTAMGMLEAATWMQQATDHCAAEPPNGYSSCIQAQLGACQRKLRQTWGACVASAQPPADPVPYPNAPWSPLAQSVSVSYSAHCGPEELNYFYLLPFGGYQATTVGTYGIPLLAPPVPGSLELGFSNLSAAQPLGMLVQMCAAMIAEPPQVSWEYLVSEASGTHWQAFDPAEVPRDTTHGLQNTGVLTLNFPVDTQAPQTLLDPQYRWLRAVTRNPDEFPDVIGFYPHVVTATWINDGTGSGEHLSKPLPADTIASTAQTINGIATIDQPIESFGGRPAQNEATFRTVLAERLRHKDRAILEWDYERLVLEAFPTIWKVQALAARSTAGGDEPGRVLAVIVAGPQSVQVADPTEPLVAADMLAEVQTFLAARASTFAVIQVVNPVYVRIQVTASVMFQDSSDGGGGIDRLNSDLVQYLSPWFYTAERAASKGTYADEDAISQYIQNRPYVAALVDIAYAYDPPPETQEWYFLTSAKSHKVSESDDPGPGENTCFLK